MTPDEVATAVARAFVSSAALAWDARGRFFCAVPGGSVAARVFPELATADVDWPRVHVWLADERLVPPDDVESNQHAVRRHWLDRVPAGERFVFHVPAIGDATPQQAAERWSRDLTSVAGIPPTLDLVVLGIGEDGHVASLFPGDPTWRDAADWAIGVPDAPKPPPRRVSLGLATLAAAREIWFVAFGAGKAATIADCRRNPGSRLPAAIVARSGPAIRWFLDAAASGS